MLEASDRLLPDYNPSDLHTLLNKAAVGCNTPSCKNFILDMPERYRFEPIAFGARNGVQVPTQKRHCKREAVPKRLTPCDESQPLWGLPCGKVGNGRRGRRPSYRKSGYSLQLQPGFPRRNHSVHKNVCTRRPTRGFWCFFLISVHPV